MRRRTAFALAAALGLLCVTAARAQIINLAGSNTEQPIEVFADDGIEWVKNDETLIARGNAKAVRGDVTVLGNVLRAFYSPRQGGGTDLTRLDAEGDVKITSPTQTITGQAGVYDLTRAILVISGRHVKFVSGTDVITANQQMEYYESKQMAVARGGARAVHGDKSLSANTLVAYFRRTKDGRSEVHQVDAFSNVDIVTPTDRVRSDKGVYNVTSGIATLVGRVRITRGDNVLTGDKAEVNLNTGVSKLLMEPRVGSRKGGRVRGLILPHKPGPAEK